MKNTLSTILFLSFAFIGTVEAREYPICACDTSKRGSDGFEYARMPYNQCAQITPCRDDCDCPLFHVCRCTFWSKGKSYAEDCKGIENQASCQIVGGGPGKRSPQIPTPPQKKPSKQSGHP